MTHFNFQGLSRLVATRTFKDSKGKPLVAIEFEQDNDPANLCMIITPEEWKEAERMLLEIHMEGVEPNLFTDFN